MKIISKNEGMNTITIEVEEEFMNDLMDCVRLINTRLCEKYNLKYQRNLFTNFDELVVDLLRWKITYGIEDSINEIIENKKDWWEEYMVDRNLIEDNLHNH
jgi:hypothetical protein